MGEARFWSTVWIIPLQSGRKQKTEHRHRERERGRQARLARQAGKKCCVPAASRKTGRPAPAEALYTSTAQLAHACESQLNLYPNCSFGMSACVPVATGMRQLHVDDMREQRRWGPVGIEERQHRRIEGEAERREVTGYMSF